MHEKQLHNNIQKPNNKAWMQKYKLQYHSMELIITTVMDNHYCGGNFALLWLVITTVVGYYAYCGGYYALFCFTMRVPQ